MMNASSLFIFSPHLTNVSSTVTTALSTLFPVIAKVNGPTVGEKPPLAGKAKVFTPTVVLLLIAEAPFVPMRSNPEASLMVYELEFVICVAPESVSTE
jgi:hypothetical protein